MARSYHRVFYVLKEDSQGYGAQGRAPVGRCVIEARGGVGKVTIYVQDLKPLLQYRCLLIKRGMDKSFGAFLGSIEISNHRSHEIRFDVNPDNLGGHGFPIEDFDTVAIAFQSERMVFPLTGGAANDVRWKANLIMEPETKTEIKEPEPAPAPVVVQEAEDDAEEDLQEAVKAEVKEEMKEEVKEEAAGPEEIPFVKMTEHENPRQALGEIARRVNKELNELAEMASEAEPETSAMSSPPSQETGDESGWKEISLRELMLLPVNLFDHEQKAIVAAAYHKHGHLIVRREENRHYTLGIPGHYVPEDVKNYKRMGFDAFRSLEEEIFPGVRGYWLKEL